MKGQGKNKRRHQRIIVGKNNGLIVKPEPIGQGFSSNGKHTKGKRLVWKTIKEGKGVIAMQDFKARFGGHVVIGQHVSEGRSNFTVLSSNASGVVVKHHERRFRVQKW